MEDLFVFYNYRSLDATSIHWSSSHRPKFTVLSILCVGLRFSFHCVFIIFFILCVSCVRSIW